MSNRDFTIKITWEPEPADGKAAYRSSWVAANEEGPAPQPGLMRVLVNDGSWTLEPVDGGKRTRATYYLYTDPGGIPGWVVNMGNKKALPELFKAVRTRSRALP
ncbi:MAG: hypothetical protein HY748_15130 [Elusimicrobia bacterium]|nr:hypothetical protein [Elusimicrobiota bacterium]